MSPLTFIIFSVVLCNLVSSLHSDSPQPIKNVFILAGQSNMAGRGGVHYNKWDGIVPPECRPNPLILRLSVALMWEEAEEPLHRDIDINKPCGVGPGMPFSNSILERDTYIGQIGLVPCAIGATSIHDWHRGGKLYNQLVTRAQAAVQGGGGIIRAILWYQGESDTENLDDAKQYKTLLVDFITNVTYDLNSQQVPFIQVALASGKDKNFTDEVRKAQLETCTLLPNVICVDAKGLPLLSDNLHLTTESQVQLGKMLADAFLNIVSIK